MVNYLSTVFLRHKTFIGKNFIGMSKRKIESGNTASNVKQAKGGWMLGLKDAVKNKDLHIHSTEEFVIIKDKYPKARFHYLILPIKEITNLKRLQEADVVLLQKMLVESQNLAKRLHRDVKFRYGYHAVPSMSQLHMHMISQDFDSPSLKTKKHWNSFTTDFFLDAAEVIEMMEEFGEVDLDSKYYGLFLEKDLKCHICQKEMKNMPSLKSHIRECTL